MSDRMRPIPFARLMDWALSEYETRGSLFGVHTLYRHRGDKALSLFGERLETPVGPAAGPHTQLAQNIIAAYAAGARFFELKTVQIIDGEDLPVSKPCILAAAEGYNVEWSTELRVEEAFDEYVKAWYALKLLSRALGLGAPDGFVFNMSVGYDLAGIQSEKIDRFIEGLGDAGQTPIWAECAAWARAHLSRLPGADQAFLDGISPRVCRSITLSTLHGCPPDEIERIAVYLITQKGLHTYVKCNPTLLGYAFARETLDSMGYDELVFDAHHFENDLQYADAVPMFNRLMALARTHHLAFGVKLSNTFPVTIAAGELPGEEMYMSGKSLYPLTAALAARLSRSFGGALPVSYSGGADAFHVGPLFSAGIWPITVATTLLKPGGYSRLHQLASTLAAAPYSPFSGVDADRLAALAQAAKTDPRHMRPVKSAPRTRAPGPPPLTDCFLAGCESGCPIGQDIPAYLHLVGEGRYEEALAVICEKNPLPFITGTLCPHPCQGSCVRGFYEEPVQIRAAKLLAAQRGWDGYRAALAPRGKREERVAVVGGGPAGMAAAFFLARAGAAVTLFEQRPALGGVVRYAIPAFRISDAAIDRDVSLLEALGVEIRLETRISSVDDLYAQGYTHVLLACGAWKPGELPLADGAAAGVLDFLETAKLTPHALSMGKRVAVIGGGNTAMDAARAAKQVPGVEQVLLLYRRTRRQMPADAEELALALANGVEFHELLAPVSFWRAVLTCKVMALGPPDESGRRGPIPTGETVSFPVDTLISAVGEQVDSAFLARSGVPLDRRGRPAALRANDRLFVIGDARRGPATVVEAIADATAAVEAILGVRPASAPFAGDAAVLRARRGVLALPQDPCDEARCLGCAQICELCVEVCPNRANLSVLVPGAAGPQVVHVDAMCNECGNCATFCPYEGAPYRDKWTLFSREADFADSENQGFLPLSGGGLRLRLNGAVFDAAPDDARIPAQLRALIQAVLRDVPHCQSPKGVL